MMIKDRSYFGEQENKGEKISQKTLLNTTIDFYLVCK